VHDEAELERALRLRSRLIGVNNRDLRDFSVDLGRTEALAGRVPPEVALVAESGLATRADLDRLAAAGVRRFLIGETLMRADDIAAATRALVGGAE
jgi:indole-3-glycerol phosphate synthase